MLGGYTCLTLSMAAFFNHSTTEVNMSFKIGAKVRAVRSRSGHQYTGKVAGKQPTSRGDWFEVKCDDGTVRKFRAAEIRAL